MKRGTRSWHMRRRQFLGQIGVLASSLMLCLSACGRRVRRSGQSEQVALPPDTPTPAAQTIATHLPTSPSTTSPSPTPLTVTRAPSPPPATNVPPELAADTVLVGGNVITIDPHDSIAEGVAMKDGLIQAVGSGAEILALVGPETKTIRLEGQTVTPGLIDPHNHLQVMGLLNGYYVPLMPPEVKSIADLQAKLAEYLARTPEGEWVQGYFMVVSEGKLPTRQDLDPVSPKHPVWIVQQGGHYGSANSMALQVAGIDRSTPDPVGGLIERDARGEPTGVFYNHRAMDLLRRHVTVVTPEMVHQNIIDMLPVFAACGVTTFHDNNVRGVSSIQSYLEAGARGEVNLRGAVYYTLEWPGDVQRALKEIDYESGSDAVRFAGFKFLLDGQLKMAYCHEPHNGVRWDVPTWEPKVFKDAVRQLHDTGLQICVHCAGDAAVDLTLDAFEEAMNANPRPDPRHRIEHAVLTTPESTKRMKDLGVVVSTQPQFIRLGGDTYPLLFGEARARRALVTREWLDAGVPLALGSDAPTTPWHYPQATLFGAVARVAWSGKRFEPEQALTIQEALRAHTMGSAYAGHDEDSKGSIEPGKLADLAVWEQDPYSVPTNQIWKLQIVKTIVGGELVFEA